MSKAKQFTKEDLDKLWQAWKDAAPNSPERRFKRRVYDRACEQIHPQQVDDDK